MNISIFGMGYVGCVLSAGHTSQGHKIVGVDINENKVALLNKGVSPVIEEGIEGHLIHSIKNGLFQATTNVSEAIVNSQLSIICVGTPSKKNGEIDLTFTLKVTEDIALSLSRKKSYHLFVYKNTIFPNTIETKLIPLIEQISCKKVGVDFGVCHNPEFLREGSGMNDFFNPPLTVIGQLDTKSGDMLEQLYQDVGGDIIRTTIKIGEMIKYINNSFHALKVTFGNEIGRLAKNIDIDSHALMKIFCMDTVLNLSPYYLTPGTPYGGSCLTKDLLALRYEAGMNNIDTPLLDSINISNERHIEYCIELIKNTNKKNIGICGLSFKENTDDLRSSAIITIIDNLYKAGYKLKVYDPAVIKSVKFGENKDIYEKKFPFLNDILVSSLTEIKTQDVIIIKNYNEEYKQFVTGIDEDKTIIDMVRITDEKNIRAKYIGICW